jgi:hypothetical protein
MSDESVVKQNEDDRQRQEPSLRAATSPESKPINSTCLRRFLVLAAVKLLKRIRPHQGTVLFISDNLCIKFGPLRHLPEASTIQFIAEHTSIPVPKIYCAFIHKGWTYIAMERLKGEMVGRNWGLRSAESKAKILLQLKKMVEEMRSIRPLQEQGVSNVDGGPLWDCRLPGISLCHGPFKTIHDFHKYLRGGCEAHPDHLPEINKLIALQDRHCLPPVFTHGDLSSLNVLVRGDQIVGIIDWETAGWYPSYWEYTTAWQVNPRNYFWRGEIDKFLEPMPTELEMEMIRLKYFGDV